MNAGFFQNAGKTRRQGLELGAHARVSKLNLALNYGYVQATFQSSLTINSPSNTSANAAGDIQVHLRARCASDAEAAALLVEVAGPIELLLGDRIYSRIDIFLGIRTDAARSEAR